MMAVKGNIAKSLSSIWKCKKKKFYIHCLFKDLMQEILEDILYFVPKPFQDFQAQRIPK